MRSRDEGVSTVVGAIIILAILGTSLLYVNAFYVPRQGASLEVGSAERTEAALMGFATALRSGSNGPSLHDIPLRPSAGQPPLLAGVVLSPVRASGFANVDTTSPLITISAVLDAPAEGVPANDPIREDLGAGKMRLYLLGNRTQGLAVGALVARVGGAYTSAAEFRVEGGLVLSNRSEASLPLAPAGIFIQQGSATTVSWRIPLLAGASQDVAGGSSAQVGLRPGPESMLGGGRVYNMSVRIETANIGAWSRALSDALGSAAIVNQTRIGDIDNGTVDAIVLPPGGTPATTRAVEMRLWAIRYEVTLTQR